MKKSSNFKVLISAVLSVVLATVMAFCVAFAPTIVAKAATIFVSTISNGESSRLQWGSLQEYTTLKLDIKQAGLYTITFEDHNKTGMVGFVVYNVDDEDEQEPVSSGSEIAYPEPYVSEEIFLQADQKYEVNLYYVDDEDFYSSLDADITVKLDKVTMNPTTIPNGSLSQSDLMLSLEQYCGEWLSYKSGVAGDYSINYQGLHAYFTFYKVSTGEQIIETDTEYYDGSEWYLRNKNVVTLEANTNYYIYVFNYSESSITTKLSISKNAKDVKNIAANNALYDIDCRWAYEAIDATIFNYKVTYSDNTSSVLYDDEVQYEGYELPEVTYMGDSVWLIDEYVLIGGKQPVVSEYKGIITHIYIDVKSYSDIYHDLSATVENENCTIDYQDEEAHTYIWRVNVSQTGMYGIWRNNADDFGTHFSKYSIEIIDERNNIIKFDDNIRAWPLIAGREYILLFMHQYDDYVTKDITFWLKKECDTVFPDTNKNGWYHDAVTYAVGRGILKGYGDGRFGTADGIQRQDFLVMLARLDNVNLEEYANQHGKFKDVAYNSYFEAAVTWGYENGIVTGYQNGNFGVGDPITREQIVTFLYRYAKYKGVDTSYLDSTKQSVKNAYSDYPIVSDYAINPVLWAIEKGVIKGKSATNIEPHGNAQRCEVAQIMYNISKNEIF